MINQMERERVSTPIAADESDEEEAKMEKFYELIRRFNEARAYHLHNQVEDYHSQEQQININRNFNSNQIRNCCGNQSRGAKIENNNRTPPNFIPSFKWEDFRDVFGNREEEEDEEEQVDVSDKSGNNFLLQQPSTNSGKKRKIDEANNDNDNENENDGYGIGTAVDGLKNTRPQLDLNLAL